MPMRPNQAEPIDQSSVSLRYFALVAQRDIYVEIRMKKLFRNIMFPAEGPVHADMDFIAPMRLSHKPDEGLSRDHRRFLVGGMIRLGHHNGIKLLSDLVSGVE